MRTVYKYPVNAWPGARFVIRMPNYAKILAVHEQDLGAALWALVDTEMGEVNRTFQVVGTGGQAPKGDFVGTVFLGEYVLHVFETTGK